jgi:hypothetical protein
MSLKKNKKTFGFLDLVEHNSLFSSSTTIANNSNYCKIIVIANKTLMRK